MKLKLLHLADLHIGKKLNEYSLLDDQKHVLKQALSVARKCQGVLIAGDIYDTPMPSAEAMEVFDWFLSELYAASIQVYMISGNHDSSTRIAYFAGILEDCGIHTSEQFDGTLQTIPVCEGCDIHLLRYIRPAEVRRLYPDASIISYEDAVRTVLQHSPIDASKVNILVAHQFITGGITSESEIQSVGGLGNISASVLDAFDYVALGHLHQPQSCGRNTIRYAGSPLKYSVSEENQKKSFTLLTVDTEAHTVSHEQIPIQLPHDVRTMRGTFEELMQADYTEDFVRVILTDEIVPPDARILLRNAVFPNMLRYSVENSKTKSETDVEAMEQMENKSPLELFSDFYEFQNQGVQPSAEQLAIVQEIFDELKEEDI